MSEMMCGYCLGTAVFDSETLSWVHATSGERVTPGVSGDYVSARHNLAGAPINIADLAERED